VLRRVFRFERRRGWAVPFGRQNLGVAQRARRRGAPLVVFRFRDRQKSHHTAKRARITYAFRERPELVTPRRSRRNRNRCCCSAKIAHVHVPHEVRHVLASRLVRLGGALVQMLHETGGGDVGFAELAPQTFRAI
jgi:hypothetical protein